MSLIIERSCLEDIGVILCDDQKSLAERFRALFTLENLGGDESVNWIAKAFVDTSALLKHELAYCLGQMKNPHAISYLTAVLADTSQEPMVRHEAGEALGAIGTPEVLPILKLYIKDPVVEVAETCQLAVERVEWLKKCPKTELNYDNKFGSVDPAPASNFDSKTVTELSVILLNANENLFERYRAMFALRNMGTSDSIEALGEGLFCPSSALFRHEIAFVLGQISSELSVPQLLRSLENKNEHEMVRHESAEALGSIATPQCVEALKMYAVDKERVVRESCEVALDMAEYENNQEFQYANTLAKIGLN